MYRGPEYRIVPVEEVMPYVSEGVLDKVPLQETHDGRLGAAIPERGRGRYSIPNAIARKEYFEADVPVLSLQERRQWNANHRLDPIRRNR